MGDFSSKVLASSLRPEANSDFKKLCMYVKEGWEIGMYAMACMEVRGPRHEVGSLFHLPMSPGIQLRLAGWRGRHRSPLSFSLAQIPIFNTEVAKLPFVVGGGFSSQAFSV